MCPKCPSGATASLEMGLVSQRDPLPSLQLDCAALAPLQARLEQVWRLTQQCLCQGPCCGANRAAGFKR